MPDVVSPVGRVHLRWMLTEGVGPTLFARILERYKTAEAALAAPIRDLKDIKGIGQSVADQIARTRDSAEVNQQIEAEIAAAEETGARLLCREDSEYPYGLRHIPDPPIILFVRGDLRPTDAVAIAIVGSRRCSIYGSEQARRFGELLAGAGFTVVSGLARGIDAFAHHGALDAGGRSIAVMGSGLIDVYPPENRALADRLLGCGAWISELPLRAAVRAQNFPGRNRIIAGMSLGTIVVEAAAASGALITAKFAAEYNREVFAVPGRIGDPASIGTNNLIRRAHAKLVTCLDDVLDEISAVAYALRGESLAGVAPPASLAPASRAAQAAPGDGARAAVETEPRGASERASATARLAQLSEVERKVYEVVGVEPSLQDAVIRRAELPAGDVLAAFTALELKRLIKRLPGQWVARISR